jgi:hypothetical protein
MIHGQKNIKFSHSFTLEQMYHLRLMINWTDVSKLGCNLVTSLICLKLELALATCIMPLRVSCVAREMVRSKSQVGESWNKSIQLGPTLVY